MTKFFRRTITYTIICLTILLSMFMPVQKTITYGYSIKDWLENIFVPKTQSCELPEVYLGGMPLGFTIDCDGVVVIAVGGVHTSLGVVSTIVEGEVNSGDVIMSIDGVAITSAHTISKEMKKQETKNQEVVLSIRSNGQTKQVKVLPARDIISNEYKLGLWVRDNSAGVGTLTYIRADNNRFGALGHSVCDIDTGTMLPLSGGNIYKCNIIGVSQSKRGTAGELKGLFLRNGTKLGSLSKNTDCGVFGMANQELIDIAKTKLPVAQKNQVKTGRASIFCAIEGTEVKEYAIEIIKTTKQNKLSTKSMVIRIIDEELIEKTGGIVQGMSGSPIVQNGMLVGAVTHVFVSDPTKGYGIYAEWMIATDNE